MSSAAHSLAYAVEPALPGGRRCPLGGAATGRFGGGF